MKKASKPIAGQTNYYVVHVVGCVDPELVGPYSSRHYRNKKARLIRNNNSDEDAIFWMNVSRGGQVKIGAYSNAFMEG